MTDYDFETDILSVTELAEYLKIGLSTAYLLIQSKEIPVFRVKKSYRILKSDALTILLNR